MSDYQPSPYTTGAAQPTQRYNVLSIVSLVLSLVGISLGGIICGHISLSQIKRTGENGRGLAIAGLVIGYAGILIGILVTVFVIIASIAAAGSGYTGS